MRKPGDHGHAAIPLWMLRRKATLVAEIDVPPAPVGLLGAQRLVNIARRGATSQYKMKRAMRNDRGVRSSQYVRDRRLLELSDAGKNMPLG